MLIELLSMSNYGNYNIKVAQILGLETAIYLNELMNINEKAIRKNKITDNCFIIDRNYIQTRTTLDSEKQQELEVNLVKLGILEHTAGDNINLNITALTSILAAPDEELKSISKIVKKTKTSGTSKSTSKKEAIIIALKESIVTTNEELVAAYGEWIEAVMAKNNWMSKKAVITAQNLIDQFSNRNLDVALKVLDIAIINGYADMSWAINSYKRNYNISYQEVSGFYTNSPPGSNSSSPSTSKPKVRLSEEVF